MKLVPVIIAFLLIFQSCNKDENPQIIDNYISAKKNGLEGKGQTEIHLNQTTDTLTLLGISNQPNSEVIVLKMLFKGAGKYSLTNEQAYYYTTTGGDVATCHYRIAENSTSELEISPPYLLSYGKPGTTIRAFL